MNYKCTRLFILELGSGSGPRSASVTHTHIARDLLRTTRPPYAYELLATIDVYHYSTRRASLPPPRDYK